MEASNFRTRRSATRTERKPSLRQQRKKANRLRVKNTATFRSMKSRLNCILNLYARKYYCHVCALGVIHRLIMVQRLKALLLFIVFLKLSSVLVVMCAVGRHMRIHTLTTLCLTIFAKRGAKRRSGRLSKA